MISYSGVSMLPKWTTEASDWKIAQSVIEKHSVMNGGEPLGIVDVVVSDDEIGYEVSNWIKELTDIFCQKYGRQQGEVITKLIVSRCMTRGHTIH